MKTLFSMLSKNSSPDVETYTVLYDGVYGVVLGGFLSRTNSTEHTIQFSQISYLTNTPALSATIDTNELQLEIRDDLLVNPRNYIYNSSLKLFYRRPTITISTVDEYAKNASGANIVPLNTNIELQVEYQDPDSIGFWNFISFLKIKDRATFVITPDSVSTADMVDYKTKFFVKSAFPGLSVIRAKDNKYICLFNTVDLIFRQV